jgi:hypothetical protein
VAPGCISLYAALRPDLLAVIFGIGVSGLLLKLASSDRGISEIDAGAA